MVIYKKGDLFKEEGLFAICHQCNCFKKMGTGIALEMKTRHPSAYIADKNFRLNSEERLGKFSLAISKDIKGNEILIFNLYGQYKYGRDKLYTDYKAVESSLTDMRNFILDYITYIKEEINEDIKVGIPHKMGCMNAGGDWNLVKEIIESVFKDSKIIAVVLNNN